MDDDAARSIFATELQDLLGVYEEQQQIAGEEEVYRDEIETAEHSDINLRSETPTSQDGAAVPHEDSPVEPRPSSSTSEIGEQVAPWNCVVCAEKTIPTDNFVTLCHDTYCRNCINKVFERAATHESDFPPRCCGVRIMLHRAQPYLRSQIVEFFERKAIEFGTVNRTYCSAVNCGEFILPHRVIDGNRAACPKCNILTCIICKSRAHDGDCPNDPALGQLMETAAENGWRSCFNCHRILELKEGCNHFTCVCLAEFCYDCGTQWGKCSCSLYGPDALRAAFPADEMEDDNGILQQVEGMAREGVGRRVRIADIFAVQVYDPGSPIRRARARAAVDPYFHQREGAEGAAQPIVDGDQTSPPQPEDMNAVEPNQ